MITAPPKKPGLKPRPLARELRGYDASEPTRIRKSMRKWQSMNETACRLGRGLGRDELIGRVASEVGASQRQVRSVLKTPR